MTIAKQTGIPYALYNPAQDRHSPQRLALMGELHHAIEHDELVLFYQPKINLNTRQVVGVEALVRWKHPSRGMIPPDQFILAYRSPNLRREVADRQHARTALRQAASRTY